jgi:ADP-heptose:LPS heptosyltransferase
MTGERDVFFDAGRTLGQSAALIRACALFISPDTGPMHLAMGLKVPLIALFGPTDPLDTGPLDKERSYVIHKSPSCNPCRTRSCVDNFCMRQISVAEVCEAADRILGSRKRDSEGAAT